MMLQQYLNLCLKLPHVHDSFEMKMFLITGKQPPEDFINVLETFAEAVELLNPEHESKLVLSDRFVIRLLIST